MKRLLPTGQSPFCRLFSKLTFNENGCWVWTGSTVRNTHRLNSQPYGYFSVYHKMCRTHRFIYELLNGSIPDSLEPDHLCRNTLCCNPTHLELVTRSVNVLRGMSPSLSVARKIARTHCSRGHPYDEANTYWSRGSLAEKGGIRECRICKLARMHKSRFKLRNAALEESK